MALSISGDLKTRKALVVKKKSFFRSKLLNSSRHIVYWFQISGGLISCFKSLPNFNKFHREKKRHVIEKQEMDFYSVVSSGLTRRTVT